MKNILLASLVVLLLADIGMQAFNLFQRHSRQPSVRMAPKGTTLDLKGQPVEGDPHAESILVEFSDYECPFCTRHATEVEPQLRKTFVLTGKIKHAFLNNPLSIHPNAKFLASAAICSGQQNHFWEMHDALFEKRPRTRAEALALTKDLGIDVGAFGKCVDAAQTAAQIETESTLAKKMGLLGTPSFALGTIDAHGQVAVKRLIAGAVPFQTFEEAINAILPKK